MKLRDFLHSLSQAFFPRRCPGCDTAIFFFEILCPVCEATLTPPAGERCPVCFEGLPGTEKCLACQEQAKHFESLRGLFVYENPLRRLILALKSGRDPRGGARAALERCIPLALRARPLEGVVPDFISYIPSRRSPDAREAGPITTLLLNYFSREAEGKICQIFRFQAPTAVQKNKTQNERLAGVKGDLVLTGSPGPARTALLLDDVATTRATLNEAARLLKGQGVRIIHCLVCAVAERREGRKLDS